MGTDESEERRLLADIQNQLQRAKRNTVRTSAVEAQRREILKRLMVLVKSPYSSLKSIAANNIKSFIKEFPDLEEDAINAVYDVCEDTDPKIRKEGYRAITLVSREQKGLVKRNADVLVQLLQSGKCSSIRMSDARKAVVAYYEPEEVEIVEHQLTEHLDMDPRVTLGVMYDQIVPSRVLVDDDDPPMRDRLRSLVLGFMVGRAKRAIVERHAQPTEAVFVEGLAKGMSKLHSEDIDILVKDILLSLPSYGRYSQSGDKLLDVLLAEANISYKDECSSENDAITTLTRTRHLLSLAAHLSIERRVARPTSLLRFYCTHFVSRIALLRLSEEAHVFVIDNFANTLAALQENAPKMATPPSAEEIIQLRNTAVDACPVLLMCFEELPINPGRPWHACRTFLQACLRRKTDSAWSVPGQFATVLQKIEEQAIGSTEMQDEKAMVQDVRDLIRSLLGQSKPTSKQNPISAPPAVPTPATVNITPKPAATNGKVNGGVVQIQRRREEPRLPRRPASGASTPNTPRKTTADKGRNQNKDDGRARTHASSTPGSSRRATPVVDPEPLAKRKAGVGGEGSVPSLLSRMAIGGAEQKPRSEPLSSVVPAKRRAESQDVQAKQVNSTQTRTGSIEAPPGGFNIKGAVSAHARRPQTPSNTVQGTSLEGGFSIKGAASREQPTSLLERLNKGGGDGEYGGGNKRRRTKT